MTTINLKDFYYWYTQDQFIEVSDEVAEVFVSDARHEISILCRRSRAAGLMPTSFLERASRKLPRPRAYMRSLFASRSSVALSV